MVDLLRSLRRRSRLWLVWALAGLVCVAAIAPLTQAGLPQAKAGAKAAILAALAPADVVYLAETHDRLADHEAQLEIVQQLFQAGGVDALGLEMFQRPFQPVLDAYLAGTLDEAGLVTGSEYEQRWGFPWAYYAPLLRFAQAQALPVLALNTPAEITRQVARAGLESLTLDQQRQIPALSEVDLSNAVYRQQLADLFAQAHSGHGVALDFENFWAAQVLWDETMAEGIAQYLQAHPGDQMVVLAGQGHLAYGHGIPDRVARRLGPSLVQKTVLLNPDQAQQQAPGIADYFWFSDSALGRARPDRPAGP